MKIAQDYLEEVRAMGVGVQRAILFGSYAQNKQHEWSDIDIALFADEFIGLAAHDKERFRRLHVMPKFMSIETHTFPTIRWDENDPFIEEIKRTGLDVEPIRLQAA